MPTYQIIIGDEIANKIKDKFASGQDRGALSKGVTEMYDKYMELETELATLQASALRTEKLLDELTK